MAFEKEKNFVRIHLDNGHTYTIDINEGIIYGVRGTPLKTIPCHTMMAKEVYCRAPAPNYSLRNTLYNLFRFDSTADTLREFAFHLKLADRLDSLGISYAIGEGVLTIQQKQAIQNYFASYIKYIRDNNDEFSLYDLLEYAQKCETEKQYHEICGQYQHQISLEQFAVLCDILKHYGDFSIEEHKIALATAAACKLFDYSDICRDRESLHQLALYLTYCRALKISPKKITNFTREYSEIYSSYRAYKAEYDNEQIKKNYMKHAKAWQFTFENCVVLAPSCPQDIVCEGQKMHHCVGSYVDRVIENRTYICFIRHIDKPEEPYITCQVGLDGKIGQYFLAYDSRISSEEDQRFYEAFQNYLNEIWTNEDAVI